MSADTSALEPGERDLVLSDLGEMLEALGLGDYARPESPHEVFGQVHRGSAQGHGRESEFSATCSARSSPPATSGYQKNSGRHGGSGSHKHRPPETEQKREEQAS